MMQDSFYLEVILSKAMSPSIFQVQLDDDTWGLILEFLNYADLFTSNDPCLKQLVYMNLAKKPIFQYRYMVCNSNIPSIIRFTIASNQSIVGFDYFRGGKKFIYWNWNGSSAIIPTVIAHDRTSMTPLTQNILMKVATFASTHRFLIGSDIPRPKTCDVFISTICPCSKTFSEMVLKFDYDQRRGLVIGPILLTHRMQMLNLEAYPNILRYLEQLNLNGK